VVRAVYFYDGSVSVVLDWVSKAIFKGWVNGFKLPPKCWKFLNSNDQNSYVHCT